MKSLIIGRCQKIKKSSVLDAFGAAAPKGQCPMEHRDEFLYVCLSIWMSVHPSIRTSPQARSPNPAYQDHISTKWSLESALSGMKPVLPDLKSALSGWISALMPKISPFQTDIRLLRDAQVFCYLFPESIKIHLCSAGHRFFGLPPCSHPITFKLQ